MPSTSLAMRFEVTICWWCTFQAATEPNPSSSKRTAAIGAAILNKKRSGIFGLLIQSLLVCRTRQSAKNWPLSWQLFSQGNVSIIPSQTGNGANENRPAENSRKFLNSTKPRNTFQDMYLQVIA